MTIACTPGSSPSRFSVAISSSMNSRLSALRFPGRLRVMRAAGPSARTKTASVAGALMEVSIRLSLGFTARRRVCSTGALASTAKRPSTQDHDFRFVEHLSAQARVLGVAQQVGGGPVLKARSAQPLTGVPARRTQRLCRTHADSLERFDLVADA